MGRVIQHVLLNITKLTDVDSYIQKYIQNISDKKIKPYVLDCSNNIKKQDVIELMKVFSSTSSNESGKKVYVVKNIDKANKEVCNSLLKFIENEDPSCYGIFTTYNKYKVIPTILSRLAQIDVNESDESFFKKHPIQSKYVDILSYLYKDEKELEKDLNNSFIYNLIDFCDKLINEYENAGSVKDLFEKFIGYDYGQIEKILKILFFKKKNEIFIDLIVNVEININKILLFNEILKGIGG
ncbi:MAG: hypothetical protein LBB39_00345 [Mycoplasmataceae bacterium]|jgi:DNA polymerase-3 subunit delta'|nr:hypothetical protein [Mycoplasmataceae bacterium]